MNAEKRILNYVRELECLDIGRSTKVNRTQKEITGPLLEAILLDKRHLKALQRWRKGYVAVSYTWRPAPDEPNDVGRYCIGTRPNTVRNIVLDRAVSYARYRKCRYVWIDQECIPEGDCQERKQAIDTMDLVYHLSNWPVALLHIY